MTLYLAFLNLIVRVFWGTGKTVVRPKVSPKCSAYVEYGKITGEAVCVISVTDWVADPGESPSNDSLHINIVIIIIYYI